MRARTPYFGDASSARLGELPRRACRVERSDLITASAVVAALVIVRVQPHRRTGAWSVGVPHAGAHGVVWYHGERTGGGNCQTIGAKRRNAPVREPVEAGER